VALEKKGEGGVLLLSGGEEEDEAGTEEERRRDCLSAESAKKVNGANENFYDASVLSTLEEKEGGEGKKNGESSRI